MEIVWPNETILTTALARIVKKVLEIWGDLLSLRFQSKHTNKRWGGLVRSYIQMSGGRLITATRNNTENTRTNRTTIIRKQKREENQLYGRLKRLRRDHLHWKTWTGLSNGNHTNNGISADSSTKQRPKDQSYQNKNKQDTIKKQM